MVYSMETLIHRSLLIFLSFIFTESYAQTFPAGFSQVKVADIVYPTSMAFATDGRIFCTEKAGKVKIIKNGSVLTNPFLEVSVNQLDERGLGGITLDPEFEENNFVYIYYTTSAVPIHNKLSRFTAKENVAQPGSELVLLDFEPCVNSIHNGGGMAFGPDGKLYLAIGNDNVNNNSQDINSYKGKVIRINKDGSVPVGNPYNGTEAAKRVWALGLRNPWTISFQKETGRLFVNDVGEGSWEEINDCTESGKNFGWPAVEGNGSNPAYTNPVYAYSHGAGFSSGCAISGGDFFGPASTNYPSAFLGKYFFIDYCNAWINYLDLSSPVAEHNFVSGLSGTCNCLKTGADGNLYYFGVGENALYKIIYSSNSAPVITKDPSNTIASLSENAAFYVSASGALPLKYQWQKNGVNIPGANSSSLVIPAVQYSNTGQYKAIVSNSFGSATSNSAGLTVTEFNARPVATILSPALDKLYRGGDTIYFTGDAVDPEDGILAASAFTWVVEFHHGAHFHPGPFIPNGVKSSSFSVTRTGEKSADVWFRLILTVKDSKGSADTAYLDILPKKSVINFLTDPIGLKLLFNDQPVTTSFVSQVVSGTFHNIDVVTPQTVNGTNYVFDKWLNEGAHSQMITAADYNQTFVAIFKPEIIPGLLEQLRSADEWLKVYPNPSTGLFTFEICLEERSDVSMSINVINSNGNMVYEKSLAKVSGCIKETVELKKGLSEGIYFMELKLGDKVRSTRLILMNETR